MPTPQEIQLWLQQFRALVNIETAGIGRQEVREQAGSVGFSAALKGSTYKNLLRRLNEWDRLPKDNLDPEAAQEALEKLVEVVATAEGWLNKRGEATKASEADRRQALIGLVQRAMAAERAARDALVGARRRHDLAQRLIAAVSDLEPVLAASDDWANTAPTMQLLGDLKGIITALTALSQTPVQDLPEALGTVQDHLAAAQDLLKRGQLYRHGEDVGGGGTPALNSVAQRTLTEAVANAKDTDSTFLRSNGTIAELAVKQVIKKTDTSGMERALDDAAAVDVDGATGEDALVIRFKASIAALCDVSLVPKPIAGMVASGIDAADNDGSLARIVAANILCLRWVSPYLAQKRGENTTVARWIQWVANNKPIGEENILQASKTAIEEAKQTWGDFVVAVVASANLPVMRELQDAQARFEDLEGALPQGWKQEKEQTKWAKSASERELANVLQTSESVANAQREFEASGLDASIYDKEAAERQLTTLLPLVMLVTAMQMANAANCKASEVLPKTPILDWTDAQVALLRLGAEKEFSTEGVDFLIEHRHGLGDMEHREMLAGIYIKESGDRQVNISSGLRRRLLGALEDDGVWLRVATEVDNLVSRDTLSRVRADLRKLDA